MSLLLALTDSVAPVTGTVAFTEGNDTAAAAATYGPTASIAFTEADDTAAATATYGPTASIAFTEADDTIAATGSGGTVVADVDSFSGRDTAPFLASSTFMLLSLTSFLAPASAGLSLYHSNHGSPAR